MPDIKIPEGSPRPGEYYYHYKHDPNGPLNNGAYRIDRLEVHTETHELMVSYRPLYPEAPSYKAGSLGCTRPLVVFMSDVITDGSSWPRFMKIEDIDVRIKLREIFESLYPEERWNDSPFPPSCF